MATIFGFDTTTESTADAHKEIYGKEASLNEQSLVLIQQCKSLKIMDEVTYVEAGRLYNLLKKIKDQFCVYFAPEKERAHLEHKKVCDKEKMVIEPITERMGWLKADMGKYDTEQARKRQVEQEKLEWEAQAKADKERQTLLAKAETAKTPEKKEALIEQAKEVYVQPMFAESATPKTIKVDGVSITKKTDLKITITDKKLVISSILNGTLPDTIILFDMQKLKAYCKLMNYKKNAVEGLVIEEVVSSSVRGD